MSSIIRVRKNNCYGVLRIQAEKDMKKAILHLNNNNQEIIDYRKNDDMSYIIEDLRMFYGYDVINPKKLLKKVA